MSEPSKTCKDCSCGCNCPVEDGDDNHSTVIRLDHNHPNYCKACIGCILIEINNATEETALHSKELCKHGNDIEDDCCEECIAEQYEPIHQCDPNSELPENQ